MFWEHAKLQSGSIQAVGFIMIAGDSLTSDMQGGVNAGIVTCWYNPEHAPLQGDLKIDYEIDDLRKIYELL